MNRNKISDYINKNKLILNSRSRTCLAIPIIFRGHNRHFNLHPFLAAEPFPQHLSHKQHTQKTDSAEIYDERTSLSLSHYSLSLSCFHFQPYLTLSPLFPFVNSSLFRVLFFTPSLHLSIKKTVNKQHPFQ
ncbi:hypothetical protein VNO77_06565 [Canavalia gladiata]|uniref:Uncharacterized protein n=1 Tax=Canavalia gladiata TaxID=3824 RepID=A0AAN9M7P5_CANGL